MKKGVVVVLGILGLFVALAVIALMWAVGVNNKMVGLNNKVDSSWAQVQNQYQRRYDLIPNLVRTVEGAANFERGTLQGVVNARASVGQVKIDPNAAPTDPAQLQKFQAAQDQLSSALSRLLVVVERYPDLKANQNFANLQVQIEGTENRISVERRTFNETVREYNTYIQQVPANIVASFRNFKTKPFFQAVEGSERPPEVQFNFGGGSNTNQ